MSEIELHEALEEISQPIEKTLADLARKIYKEDTGKDWEAEPPPADVAELYVEKAARQLLERWHRYAVEAFQMVKTLFGTQPTYERVLAQIGPQKFISIPMKEVQAGKEGTIQVLRCPRCKVFAMKMKARGLYVCSNCGYALYIFQFFKER